MQVNAYQNNYISCKSIFLGKTHFELHSQIVGEKRMIQCCNGQTVGQSRLVI